MNDIELDELAWESVCGQDHSTVPEIAKLDTPALAERALCHVYRMAVLPYLSNPSELFKRLNDVWYQAHSYKNASFHSRALANVHNEGVANGLGLAVAAIEQGGDVFVVTRILAETLPLFMRIAVQDLLRFCEAAYPRTKNDLANGVPYNAAEQWLAQHPEDVEEVISSCLAAPSEGLASLLRVALIRAAANDPVAAVSRIHDLRLDETTTISSPAIEALGLLDWSLLDRSAVAQAVAALREGLASSDEARLFFSAAGALWLVNQSPDDHRLIDHVAMLDKPFITRLVGDHLGFRADTQRTQPWFPEKIMLLAPKLGQHPNSHHGIDHVLSSFLKDDATAGVPERWLNAWVHAHKDDSDTKESFAHLLPQLFDKLWSDGRLGRLVISWLLDDDLRVQRAAREVLEELGRRGHFAFRIQRETIDTMSPAELLHLVRRILGNVFRDEQLVALIWSLTETQSAESRTFPLVHEVLADKVGYSYPQATRAHLEQVISAEGESSLGRLAKVTLQRMEHYFDELNSLPPIEELRPSDGHRERYRKASQRAMNRAYEEAGKNSILQIIATKIPLKGGRSSFSRHNGQIGEKMHLSTFSHSMAFPRADAIDSVGCAIERFHFQLAKVGDK